ncbi:conserved hypothetical protein [Candidatus Magnetomoraceae bacterium gMMP-15]
MFTQSMNHRKQNIVCNRFSNELEQTIHQITNKNRFFLLTMPGLLFRFFQHRMQSHKTLFAIRTALEFCNTSCKDASCLDNIYEDAKAIRDKYYEIFKQTSGQSIFFLFNMMIKDTLSDWDDLVEDCVIGSDKEIRSMISDIAERL